MAAYHIQLVLNADPRRASIIQGNSRGIIARPLTTIMRIFGFNRADPRSTSKNFLREFQLYRWNFPEFNLCGVLPPGRGVRFYANDTMTAQIDDPAFAAAFFGIWLDPRTRADGLRKRLLGGTTPTN